MGLSNIWYFNISFQSPGGVFMQILSLDYKSLYFPFRWYQKFNFEKKYIALDFVWLIEPLKSHILAQDCKIFFNIGIPTSRKISNNTWLGQDWGQP